MREVTRCLLSRTCAATSPWKHETGEGENAKKGRISLTVGGLGSKEFVSSVSRISPRFSDSRGEKDRCEGRKKYLAGCLRETSHLPEVKHSITTCVRHPRQSFCTWFWFHLLSTVEIWFSFRLFDIKHPGMFNWHDSFEITVLWTRYVNKLTTQSTFQFKLGILCENINFLFCL